MIEKKIELPDWPEAKAAVRMFTMIEVTDIHRAMNKKNTGLPFAGEDLSRFFKKALVSYENVPLLNKENFTGDLEADELNYVKPMFAFDVVMAALAYSGNAEDEVKNS